MLKYLLYLTKSRIKMKVLIVSATTLEIKPLLEKLQFDSRQNAHLNTYNYQGFEIDVLITGVGMVPTAFLMGQTLSRKNYDAALNFGIAGCFNRNIPLGQVLHITSDQFPELGAENGEYFLSLLDLKLLEENCFPFKNGELINDTPIASSTIGSLKPVKAITVNTISGNESRIESLRLRVNPVLESMEGAAFLYACLAEGVPCAQIRAVSNYVEPRDPKKWNIPLAIENLNRTIFSILHE